MSQPRFIPKLQTIAGLVAKAMLPVRTKLWVTSTNWGLIAQEVEDHYLEPGQPKPSRANFARLNVGKKLLVINAGTEDEEVCQALNEPEFERARFTETVERARSLYGTAANA